MEKRERQFIPGLSVLLLAVLVMGGIGMLLHDFNGVGYGAVGALLWGGALFVTFLLGTVFLSRRLLPIQGNIGWTEGFRLLWRNYLAGLAGLLYGTRREPVTTLKKKKSKGPSLAPSFSLLGAGFLFSHEVAAITRGSSYARAAGPGLVFLGRGERIAQVFDLRTQSRKQSVSAMTRDGIPVETSVSVSFHVRRLSSSARHPRSIAADPIPYSYDREAIFHLNYAGSMAGAEERLSWTEQVCPAAATLLISEIGKYTLDQLLVSAGAEPLSMVREAVKSGLLAMQEGESAQTLSRGIEITGVGVGPLELPEEVVQKRITTWQVVWQNKIAHELVGGDIEAQRLYQEARARAQVENIETLLTSIETIRQQSQAELHEVVMTRLVEVLEALSASRTLSQAGPRAQLPGLASLTSRELRQIMESED